jgi:hypothetical protein
MAKGQKKINREAKKPKQEKSRREAAAPSLIPEPVKKT